VVRRNVEIPSHGEMVANLLGKYAQASEQAKVEGRTWYDEQREFVRQTACDHGFSANTVAAIVATLSPQTRWAQNVAGTIRIINAFVNGDEVPPRNTTLFYRQALKAWKILQGENPSDLLTSRKIGNFWQNLAGNEQAITVDIWMLRAAGISPKVANAGVKDWIYDAVSDAIREAASVVAEVPSQFQAIIWIVERGKGS
jgi:hypothetical protein